MPLSPGTRLGPYEIAAPRGACGMGEVYRARDSRMGRGVSADGKRFIMAAGPEGSTEGQPLRVVVNWLAGVKK